MCPTMRHRRELLIAAFPLSDLFQECGGGAGVQAREFLLNEAIGYCSVADCDRVIADTPVMLAGWVAEMQLPQMRRW